MLDWMWLRLLTLLPSQTAAQTAVRRPEANSEELQPLRLARHTEHDSTALHCQCTVALLHLPQPRTQALSKASAVKPAVTAHDLAVTR
jgi:hypothetical protein